MPKASTAHRHWLVRATLVALGVASCSEPLNTCAPSRATTDQFTRMHEGWPRATGLGLQFSLPPTHRLQVHATHIEMTDTRAVRRPVTITLTHGGTSPHGLAQGSVIATGRFPAAFEVRRGQGGSGGDEYTLVTHKRVGNTQVTIIANRQAEHHVPTFPEAWAVWASLTKF